MFVVAEGGWFFTHESQQRPARERPLVRPKSEPFSQRRHRKATGLGLIRNCNYGFNPPSRRPGAGWDWRLDSRLEPQWGFRIVSIERLRSHHVYHGDNPDVRRNVELCSSHRPDHT